MYRHNSRVRQVWWCSRPEVAAENVARANRSQSKPQSARCVQPDDTRSLLPAGASGSPCNFAAHRYVVFPIPQFNLLGLAGWRHNRKLVLGGPRYADTPEATNQKDDAPVFEQHPVAPQLDYGGVLPRAAVALQDAGDISSIRRDDALSHAIAAQHAMAAGKDQQQCRQRNQYDRGTDGRRSRHGCPALYRDPRSPGAATVGSRRAIPRFLRSKWNSSASHLSAGGSG